MKSYAIVDMGFGDSGKGKTIDWLARKLPKCKYVIKFNGGSQATHHVVLPDRFNHAFSMFGSGVFSNKSTYLTSDVYIDPVAIISEHNHLEQYLDKNILNTLNINLDCNVITLYHKALNRYKELKRSNGKHGSYGIGFGECVNMSIEHHNISLTYRDLNNPNIILDRLKAQKNNILKRYPYISEYEEFANIESLLPELVKKYQFVYHNTISVPDNIEEYILNCEDNIWEGAQGLLLDQTYGLNPYTTWSNTTTDNINKLYSKYNIDISLETIGIFRSFPTRHGKGPFPTEHNNLDIIKNDHNVTNMWQNDLRIGYLDIIMLKYVMTFCNIDTFVITHFDKIVDDIYVVDHYDTDLTFPKVKSYDDSFNLTSYMFSINTCTGNNINKSDLILYLENILNIKCKMISSGNTYKDSNEKIINN